MELRQLVKHFTLYTLNITARMSEPLSIEGFAGDMLHNNLGLVLKAIDKPLATALYDTGVSVKQFVITPDEPLRKCYRTGELFGFELTLFNACCEQLPSFLRAIDYWQRKGFMPDRNHRSGSRFELVNIESLAPLRPKQRIFANGRWFGLPGSYLLADALDGIYQNLAQTWGAKVPRLAVQVELNSPLRLTVDNRNLCRAPAPDDFFNAVVRRLWLLSTKAGITADDLPERDEFYHCLPDASDVALMLPNCRFVDMHRFDAKRQTRQALGGVIGEFVYLNIDIRHLALLEIGRLLKVGSKTTFGFGVIDWFLTVSE